MKEIQDLSVFHWNELPEPSYFHDMEFFMIRSRRTYRMRSPHVGRVDDLLHCGCVCEVKLPEDAHYLRRHAPFLSIEYVKDGGLLVRQRGKGWLLEAGDAFLMQPELESEFRCVPGGCRKISVLLEGSLLLPLLRESGLGNLDVLRCPAPERTERLLKELGELADRKEEEDADGRNALLSFALLQSLRARPEKCAPSALFAKLKSKLDADPARNWTQAEMAHLCGCSPTHLVRLFRKYRQTTPRQYLIERRMLLGRDLLADEALSIKEIAGLAGYENPMNFATEFRKRCGCSPREYRRKLSLFA